MLVTIAIILLILWALGFIGLHITLWFIHVLLVAAIVLLIIRLL